LIIFQATSEPRRGGRKDGRHLLHQRLQEEEFGSNVGQQEINQGLTSQEHCLNARESIENATWTLKDTFMMKFFWQMSNMFLGTALTKPSQQQSQVQQSQARAMQRQTSQLPPADQQQQTQPTAHVKEAVSLDELDRPENCPESVDMDSWKLTCALRRKKITSEDAIKDAAADLHETEEVTDYGISEELKCLISDAFRPWLTARELPLR
jgi:hypothetical protein